MDNPASGNLSWHHLWFLAYLFTFSMLLIPVFRYFKNARRQSLISAIAGFLEKPYTLFIAAIPLIVVNVALRPIFGWGNQNLINDWAEFLFYILIFFYGFLLVSDGRILLAVQRNKYWALVGAAITTSILFMNNLLFSLPGAPRDGLIALSCWCWLLAILGFGSLLLSFTNKVLRYASDAVLPVYILHQTVIVVLGYFVIQWNTGIALKYFFIVPVTLAISLAIYEMVRRTAVTRFLFGIKTKKTAAARVPASKISRPVEA